MSRDPKDSKNKTKPSKSASQLRESARAYGVKGSESKAGKSDSFTNDSSRDHSGTSSAGVSSGTSSKMPKVANDPYQVYGPNPGGRPPGKDAHRKHASLTAASDVLQALLQNSKSQLADGFVRWRLEQSWQDVVGEALAQQSLPVAYEHKILYLWVRHPAWQQQLRFFTEAIKEKVNNYLGRPYVEQVRFTLNRRAATKEIGTEGS